MKSVCFVSVVHQNVRGFLKEFLQSLYNQTYDSYDVILFNDGLNKKEIYDYFPKFKFRIIDVVGSPNEIRNQVISFLINSDYQYCVFGDADDFFENNRIEANIKLLKNYDIVANDVHLVNSRGELLHKNYFSNRLSNLKLIDPDFIFDKNIFGLGNTAIRISLLSDRLFVSENVLAVDWQIFSRILLMNDARAIFTNNTGIYYRQYDGNMIGLDSLDLEKLNFMVNVKIEHYRTLLKFTDLFNKKLASYIELKTYLLDKENSVKYLNKIKVVKASFPLWWEEIKTLEELDYESSDHFK